MKIMKRSPSPMRQREILAGYLMITPLMLGVGVFFLGAFVQNIYFSFTNRSGFGVPRFIGLDNYVRLFQDAVFFRSLTNTLLYVAICVPFVVVLAIVQAVLLNSKVKGIGFIRVLVFMPAITLPAAISLVWRWLMNYQFGFINGILRNFGIDQIAWLSDPNLVIYSISIVFIWASVAFQSIIVLAGLQGIPECYHEAAQIDGAKKGQLFFRVTLPLLSPVLFFVTVTTFINVFQIFDFIYLMVPAGTAASPAARSLVSYFFEETFVRFNMGYGAAISIMLFLLIFAITVVQLILKRRLVFYDD
jgi:multiple sugar transport system permease protein